MKYAFIASLLTSAVLAAPYAQQAGNGNQRQQGQTGVQGQTGQIQGQGVAQGQTGQTGTQGQTGQTGQTGTQGQMGQQQGAAPPAGGAATATPTDLPTAVSNWMADTSMVSNFLNTGNAMTNDTAFKAAALVAFNAEVDELTHKAIIEQTLSQNPTVQGANSTLAGGGAFQDVVDKLMIMSMMGKAAANNIDLINQNRCVNVLPNIDAYMAATGSQSQAVRPIVCDQTGIAGGVQGNGATQLGQAPGTPQAAFTAAQSLAAGTGNGVVQNGAPTQGQAGVNGQQGTQGQTPTQGQAGVNGQNGQQVGANGQQTPAQGQAGVNGQQTPAQGQAGANGQQIPAQGQAGTAGTANQGQTGSASVAGAAAPVQGQAGTAASAAAAASSAPAAQGAAGAGAATAAGAASAASSAPAAKGKGKGAGALAGLLAKGKGN